MTARRRGRLIVVEGIDGSGKSTLARALVRRWRRGGRPVDLAREPGDRRLGAAALQLAAEDPWASAMLFTLDRLLARRELAASLARGRTIVQDRSFYSTLAYQGSRMTPEGRRRLERLQRAVALRPDGVLWLSIDPRHALARVRRRGRRLASLERIRTLRAVARAYATLARRDGWIRLDAERPVEALVDEAERRLGPRRRPTSSSGLGHR